MAKEKEVISRGISMGVVMAMIMSYSVNESVWYALLHGFLSWIYVIYKLTSQ